MTINAISLQSGSSGNCIYVEAGKTKLLLDAGICGSTAAQRLADYGRDIREVNALIISHDHGDHVRYAGIYSRKYGLPVFITKKTLSISAKRHRLGRMDDVRFFEVNDTLVFDDMSIHAIPTPHDASEGSIFIVQSKGKRLGVMTDIGHVFSALPEMVSSLDAVFIESNYDPAMLSNGPYPFFLKKRIQGPGGHLSNIEAAELLQNGKKLKWACLAHLSEKNNAPDIAIKTHREVLGNSLPLYTADHNVSTGIFSI